jgi:hypothetical protein
MVQLDRVNPSPTLSPLTLVHFPSRAQSRSPPGACDAAAAWCPHQRQPRPPPLLASEAPAWSPPPFPLHEDPHTRPHTRPHTQMRETLAPTAWDRRWGSQPPTPLGASRWRPRPPLVLILSSPRWPWYVALLPCWCIGGGVTVMVWWCCDAVAVVPTSTPTPVRTVVTATLMSMICCLAALLLWWWCGGYGGVGEVLLVWCCDIHLHLDADRMFLPTQPRRRLPPLMHCELKLLPISHFSGMVAW